eukprot:1767724-Pleurochrysis_carterae.AAC.12
MQIWDFWRARVRSAGGRDSCLREESFALQADLSRLRRARQEKPYFACRSDGRSHVRRVPDQSPFWRLRSAAAPPPARLMVCQRPRARSREHTRARASALPSL